MGADCAQNPPVFQRERLFCSIARHGCAYKNGPEEV
jgi:hypothetical protein